VIRPGPDDQPPSEGRDGARGRRGWASGTPPLRREPAAGSGRRPEPRQPTRRYEPPTPPRQPPSAQSRQDWETYGDRYRDTDRYDTRDGAAGREGRRDREPRDRESRDWESRDWDPRDREFRDRDPRDRNGHGPVPPTDPDATPELPYPKKLTVTRVAALRSRQLASQAVRAFRRAAHADGAEGSGLTSLTYATMLNYASDAAMAVALANTLFFSAASAESKWKVALYLLITVAPFAIVAPVIGPMLDRLQRGRRWAMCAAAAGQALLCVIIAVNFDSWVLYPAALGKMVLSKSFTVLKAAITPRVLADVTLSKTNARLSVFGLAAGGAGGALAALFAVIFDSPGALWFAAAVSIAGAAQALRIPSWVEVTDGEVPTSLAANPEKAKRQPLGRHVVVALWGNGTIRVLTGFLMMFAAFAVRAQTEHEPFRQLLLLGLIAGAAGIGSFVGNGIGARTQMGHPEQVVLGCLVASLAATVIAAALAGVATAAVVGLVGAVASALAKNTLDAVIQDDLPEESRASAFGRSETVLQLSWVFGGATGVLLPPIWWLGFLVVSVLLAVGLAQTLLTRRGGSLIPGLGGSRPITPSPTGGFPVQQPPPGYQGRA